MSALWKWPLLVTRASLACVSFVCVAAGCDVITGLNEVEPVLGTGANTGGGPSSSHSVGGASSVGTGGSGGTAPVFPPAARPYVLAIVDSSGSMTACTAPPSTYPETCNETAPGYQLNTCGHMPTRLNDAKCALNAVVGLYANRVAFGLSTFATTLSDCPQPCMNSCTCGFTPVPPFCCGSDTYGCTAACYQEEIDTTGNCAGCGPRPAEAATRAGALLRVPIEQDAIWARRSAADNSAALLSWLDNDCSGDQEIFAAGATPLNGVLRDASRYFASSWMAPDGSVSYMTPLSENDLAGDGVNSGTSCRSVNVLLITDGDETCDSQADAVAAAADLYQNGVTIGGHIFKVRTHVVNFLGGTQSNVDAIAQAGGTGAALFATDAVSLQAHLQTILEGLLVTEVCDGVDNDCNGCTDEGCPGVSEPCAAR